MTNAVLPSDQRARMGGLLFLASLLVFFVTSLLFYALYAWSRRADQARLESLPLAFLASTACLIAISLMVHQATIAIRRDRWTKTSRLLGVSTLIAIVFLAVQGLAMWQMLDGAVGVAGNGSGVVGLVVVLAILHALHVLGGVVSLAIVAVRTQLGKYDHERHYAVDFAALYWHFLDVVWIVMLATFWATTGGF